MNHPNQALKETKNQMLTSDLVKVNYQGICSIHPIKNTAAEKVFDSITRIKQTDLYTNRNFKVMYLLQ